MWAIHVQLTLRRKIGSHFSCSIWVFKRMPPAIAIVILIFFATSHHICSPHTSSGVFPLCCSASVTSWFSLSTGSELTDKNMLDPSPWLSCSFSLVFSAVNNEENPTEKTSSFGTSDVRRLCSSLSTASRENLQHSPNLWQTAKLQQRVRLTNLSAKNEVALCKYTL